MTKRKHLKRRIRERAAKTGESYTSARRHLHVPTKENPMTAIDSNQPTMKCSFCTKTNKDVNQLIAGPGVYICDECVGLCNEIIGEAPSPENRPVPDLNEGPLDSLLPIFGDMATGVKHLNDRVATWAQALTRRGVPLSDIADLAGIDAREAQERFGL